MKSLRLALSAFLVLGLVAGYLASQYAYFTGTTAQYTEKIDQPPVRMLALLFFIAAIALAFVKDKEPS